MESTEPLRQEQSRARELSQFVRSNLSGGNVSLEDEIHARAQVAKLLSLLYEQTGDIADLDDAIQHTKSIIRQLSSESTQRSEYLNRLCYLQTSEFEARKGQAILDDAILYGREAKAKGSSEGASVLVDINHNLGYALSKRALLKENVADLDEAILCGREMIRLIETQSDNLKLQQATLNLALRLLSRYRWSQNSSDLTEAKELANFDVDQYPLGSHQRQMAYHARSQFAAASFQQTQTDEDLDEAIVQCTSYLDAAQHDRDAQISLLTQIVDLRQLRYQRKGRSVDIWEAIRQSRSRLNMTSPANNSRIDHVAAHLQLSALALGTRPSTSDIQDLKNEAEQLISGVPKNHVKEFDLRNLKGQLLAQELVQTGSSSALQQLVAEAEKLRVLYNTSKLPTEPPIESLDRVSELLREVSGKPNHSTTKDLILRQIVSWFKQDSRPQQWFASILKLQIRRGDQLAALAKCLKTQTELTDDNLMKIIETEMDSTERPNTMPPPKSISFKTRTNDYYDKITGLRQLAVNPDSSDVIFNISPSVMESLMGYEEDDIKPRDLLTFVKRELELEKAAWTKEKTAGKHPNPELCRVCRKLCILIPDAGSFSWRDKLLLPFGSLAQLQCRSLQCAICQVVLSMITFNGGRFVYPRLLDVDGDVQGVSFKYEKLPSGETMLVVNYAMQSVGALRILTAKNWLDAVRQGRDFDLCMLRSRSEPESGILNAKLETLQAWGEATAKRPVAEVPAQLEPLFTPVKRSIASHDSSHQMIDYRRIRKWLFDCYHNHGDLCNTFWTSDRGTESKSLLLVDVQEQCLKLATPQQRYFALSYVWGGISLSMTLQSNVQSRMAKDAFLSIALPVTVKDAIRLVKMVGERYLWVDALCIVQDDLKNKHDDIKQMDVIYNRAFATIVALDGKNANGGLPGVQPMSRPSQRTGSVWISDRSEHLELTRINDPKTELVTIIPTPPPLYLAIDASQWNRRGWILQERALSRRILYFTNEYVYFQCIQEVLCEARLEEFVEPGKGIVASKRNCEGPLFHLLRKSSLSRSRQRSHALKAYSDIISDYTQRSFSFPADILKAFAGLLAVFDEYFQSTNLYGLPVIALDAALLWTPCAPATRRLPSSVEADSGEVAETFPSWSWAGWAGPAEYRMTFQNENLPTSLIANFFNHDKSGVLQRLRTRGGSSVDDFDEVIRSSTMAKEEDRMIEELTTHQNYSNLLNNPEVLYFFAQTVKVSAFNDISGARQDILSKKSNVHTPSLQPVLRLQDKKGHQCGLWYGHQQPDEEEESLYEDSDTSSLDCHDTGGVELATTLAWDKELIAISTYCDTYTSRVGPQRVEGDIDLFDEDRYSATGSKSGIINALAIEWRGEVAERIAAVQIHIQAWEDAGPVRRLIRLA